MTIRRATPDTAGDAVAALADLYHRDSATIEELTALVSDEDFVLLLSLDGKRATGYLHGQILDRLDGERMLLIYDLEVAVPWRRQGVGSGLMQAAFDIGRASGASRCWLLTETDNHAACEFYGSLEGERWPAVGFRWSFAAETPGTRPCRRIDGSR